MYDTKLSSSKESAQPDIPSKEALISPFEVVVEDAASEEVIPAQYTTQDLAETDVVVDAGRIYDQVLCLPLTRGNMTINVEPARN